MRDSGGKFVRRRSLLFVPGDDPGKIERAGRTGADAVVLDLEDAVAPGAKSEARHCVGEALRSGKLGTAEVVVRINPPGTPFFDDDLEALRAGPLPTLMVPKAQSAAEISSLADKLGERARFLLLVETPRGVADALAIGQAASTVEGLCFGHADFSLEMGLRGADVTNPSVQHARATLAIAAKANHLAPIDCVHLAIRDDPGFRDDTQLGLALGYEGRLCIHPRQVELANEIYTPSEAQLDYARRVVDAFEKSSGSAVVTVDGKMVDAPLLAQQRRLLMNAGES